MLKEGDKAPDFELPADGGRTVKSSDLKGKPYVVYFYPRDNTPGCTTEACDFRDHFARIGARSAAVFGVSTDSIKSHDGFKKKFELPFTLLSDADKTLHNAYGSWGKKKFMGKESDGTIRSTFLVDKDGVIAKAWPTVKVKGHVEDVIAAVEALA